MMRIISTKKLAAYSLHSDHYQRFSWQIKLIPFKLLATLLMVLQEPQELLAHGAIMALMVWPDYQVLLVLAVGPERRETVVSPAIQE